MALHEPAPTRLGLPPAAKEYDRENENQTRAMITRALAQNTGGGAISGSTTNITFAGGNYWLDVVADFGAVGDGVTDDADAIQAAFDYIWDTPANPVRTVYLPPQADADSAAVAYSISHPLWLRRAGTRLVGSQQSIGWNNFGAASEIIPSYKYGPAVIVDAGNHDLDLHTALATGAGSSLRMSGGRYTSDHLQWLEFRDCASMELDGLAAFTLEFYYKPAVDHVDGWFMSSYGRWFDSDLANDNYDGCFTAQIVSDECWLRFTTSNGDFQCISTTKLIDSTVYHLAWSYDGTKMRFFIDGALDAEVAATGTLVQHPAEEVTFGLQSTIQPSIFTVQAPPAGDYDSIRFSQTARYTGAFTGPTAKLIGDSNTLLLLNFDDNMGPLTKAYTKDGHAWLYMRGTYDADDAWGPTANNLIAPLGWQIEGIKIRGGQGTGALNTTSGIYIGQTSLDGAMRDVTVELARIALEMGNNGNSYRFLLENVSLEANSGRYAWKGMHNTGLSHFKLCRFMGGVVCFLDQTGSKQLDECWFQPDGTTTRHAMLCHQRDLVPAPFTMVGGTFDTEAGISGSEFQSLMAVSGGGASCASMFSFLGTTFQINTVNAPVMQVYTHPTSGGKLLATFRSCGFHWFNVTPDEVVELVSGTIADLEAPVMFRDCYQYGGTIPWSLTADATLEEPRAFGVTAGTMCEGDDVRLGGANVTTVTDTYQVLVTDGLVVCNKGTDFTVTLPTATVGQSFRLKNIGVGTVTLEGSGADTIDGDPNRTLKTWDGVVVQCRAANTWSVVSAVGIVRVNNTQVVGAQGATVADATGGTVQDAEARTAINTLLARLRTHGLIAT